MCVRWLCLVRFPGVEQLVQRFRHPVVSSHGLSLSFPRGLCLSPTPDAVNVNASLTTHLASWQESQVVFCLKCLSRLQDSNGQLSPCLWHCFLVAGTSWLTFNSELFLFSRVCPWIRCFNLSFSFLTWKMELFKKFLFLNCLLHFCTQLNSLSS